MIYDDISVAMDTCSNARCHTVKKLGYEPYRHVVSILFCFGLGFVNYCECFLHEVVLKGSLNVLNGILIQAAALPV